MADAAQMPSVRTEVVLWGDDPGLADWLTAHGIRHRTGFHPVRNGDGREVILACGVAPAEKEAWCDLARRIARGSTAVFLSPGIFAKKDQPTGWLPLANKAAIEGLPSWLYHKDEWCKRHPIFAGLPCPGVMDYVVYRDIIPDVAFVGQDVPAEAVAGAINASQGYSSGLLVSVYRLGSGRFLLNTLRIRENLGANPVAERLLRNMLRFAGRDAGEPMTELPPDFLKQMQALGYR